MTRHETAPHRPIPDRLYMEAPGMTAAEARIAAIKAVEIAQRLAPKFSGASYRSMTPIFGDGWFGIRWTHESLWFQEQGFRAFVMRSLAGKTIPMWIRDPTGKVARENPGAKTMVDAGGMQRTLIFRRVAHPGERKLVRRVEGGVERMVDVPRSYPGAPGRINRREPGRPWTLRGRVGGRIAPGNVGVRWRHPGLHGRHFMHYSLNMAAGQMGVVPGTVYAAQGADLSKVA